MVQAGREAAVEATPPGREVRAEEDDLARSNARGPQPVVGTQRLEGGEQELHRKLRARLLGRFGAEQDLCLIQRLRSPQLCVERLADHAALQERRQIALAASRPFVVENLRQAALLAVQTLGLSFQLCPQASAAQSGGRQQVDADPDLLAVLCPQRGHRRGEGLERIGIESELGQRFDARAGEHQLGPQPDGLLRLRRQHLGDFAQLDTLVVAQRRPQQLVRAGRDFEQVDEAPFPVVGQPHAQGAGAAVEPAAQAAIAARQLGGEALHRLGFRVELIGRHHGDGGSRRQRATRGAEALWSQRGGDSDGAESEGRERGRGGHQVSGMDARCSMDDQGDHDQGEQRQHRPRIVRIDAHHAPTLG
jgi:hypothetical protein